MRVLIEEETCYYEIARMFIIDDAKVFVLTELEVEFQRHLMAYKLTSTHNRLVCLYSSFARFGVLHQKNKNGNRYIIEKDSADIFYT